VSLSPLGLGVAIAAALAIVVGVSFFTGFLSPPGSPAATAPATAATLVHSAASSVVVGPDGGWLADDQSGSIRRFDSSSGALLGKALHTGGSPISIASGFGRLWVADISNSLLYAIDPNTGRVSGAPITIAQGPVSVVAGDRGVWVASLLAGTVSLIDPATRQVEASVALPDGAVRLALGDGYVWVTGQTDSLTRIDRRPLGVTLQWRTVKVGKGPIGVAVGDGGVWVANAESGTVSRVNPRSLTVTGVIRVPSGSGAAASTQSDPQNVAVWQNRLWVAIGSRPEIVAFDPETGDQVGRAVSIPGVARELYVSANGGLWATTANPGTVVQLSAS
jgi:streptogramin lyase